MNWKDKRLWIGIATVLLLIFLYLENQPITYSNPECNELASRLDDFIRNPSMYEEDIKKSEDIYNTGTDTEPRIHKRIYIEVVGTLLDIKFISPGKYSDSYDLRFKGINEELTLKIGDNAKELDIGKSYKLTLQLSMWNRTDETPIFQPPYLYGISEINCSK